MRIDDFICSKSIEKKLLILVGLPGAGKSTYFRRILQPMGYEHVDQHSLGSQDSCVEAADELLSRAKAVGARDV